MKLYHGTVSSSALNIIDEGINLKCSQELLDFGRGFYTTPNKEHAIKTAKNKTLRYNRKYRKAELAAVIEFDYNENKELNIKEFSTHDREWVNFILANRMDIDTIQKNNITEHNKNQRYDIVKGEIADGCITQKAAQIRNNEIDFSDIDINELLLDTGDSYGFQISFHTRSALDCIRYLKCDILYK